MRARLGLCAGLVLGLAAASGVRAQAFHSGGTGECTACHSMHSANASGNRLLRQSDASSVCLRCHADAALSGPSGHYVATPDGRMPSGTPPLQRTPGGDFGWLKKDYVFTIRGVPTREEGSTHGHNIVAADFGFSADVFNANAPGGTFPAQELGCTSCHDPHGKYRRLADGTVAVSGGTVIASGSYATSPASQPGRAVGVYRLLAGAGYARGGVTFAGVPAAVAPDSYNRSEAAAQTRVAYGHGSGGGRETWTRWCATCHPQMLTSGHSADVVMDATVRGTYASYVKTGDMTGALATSYSSLVPFVESTSDFAELAAHARSDGSALGGPESGALVSCITCHRAHATGWEHMLRWNEKATFLTSDGAWPGIDTTPDDPDNARGRTAAETRAAYYDRPATVFAIYQRTLCNKCHARD